MTRGVYIVSIQSKERTTVIVKTLNGIWFRFPSNYTKTEENIRRSIYGAGGPLLKDQYIIYAQSISAFSEKKLFVVFL